MLIKICGVTTSEAAEAAEKFGANFLGCIFFEKSRRYISPDSAAKIFKSVSRAKKVGVFVDENFETVNNIAELVGLDFVQLHGNESADYAKKISRPIIKAYRYGDGFSAEEANNFPCEFVLLDSFVKGQAGGTGKTFDWISAANETAKLRKPLFLAGGISRENFRDAAKIFHPYALDVSGSLEVGGKKSVAKIEEFLLAVKNFLQA